MPTRIKKKKNNKITDIKLVVEFLKKHIGEKSIEVINFFDKVKKPVCDEKIEKKTKIKITDIRSILNRLHYRGIANYEKEHNQRTGWYYYRWYIIPKRIAELITEEYKDKVEKLENNKNLEENYVIFSCKKRCDNTPFEIAAEYQFTCPNCGEKMSAINNKKRIKEMNKELKFIKNELQVLKKYL